MLLQMILKSKPAVDFGTIVEGQEARFMFTFRNEGDAPLRLLNVFPSCGCTTPSWTEEPVPPGGTGTITIVFDSSGRPGTFVKSLRVATNGEPASLKLFIEGFVKRVHLPEGVSQGNLLIDRDVAKLGVIPQGTNALHTFRLQNTGAQPIHILAATTTHQNVSVEVPEQPLLPNDIAELYLVVKTIALEVGESIDYKIILETDDNDQPRKSLHITGQITAKTKR